MGLAQPLAGRTILVSRPREQAAGLCRAIAAAGGEALAFPALEIAAVADPRRAAGLWARIAEYDWVIFVSANAVRYAQNIADNGIIPPSSTLRVAAIGAATARALHEAGAGPVLVPPEPGDSEALAAMAELQDVAGRRCLIVRGEGGREWLADTLRRRGAQVDYAEVYRRTLPDADITPLLARWRRGQIHAVVATSGEILRNLAAMIGPDSLELLRTTPLATVGERVSQQARDMGVCRVASAAGASDAALLQALAALLADTATELTQ